MKQFEQVYNKRHMFAQYSLNSMKGLRGKHGNAASEMNNSSVFIHLNDGDKHTNYYIEEPHTLIRDLFK